MGFTTELVVRQHGDRDWCLVEPLRYEGNRDVLEVPPGAITDFASVPKMFQWLIPTSGRYTKHAVLHDHLWRHGVELGVARRDADGIFRRSMAESGVGFLRRWIMWTAVRWVSLARSRFTDGPRDLPRVVLLTLVPGLLLLAGGLLVLVLQLGFYLLELGTTAVLWLLRGLVRPLRSRTKPVRPPKVLWGS